jgi:transcriptional antiterminator Rof (Rho-off)
VDDAYLPIPCTLHSGLEVAVLRREGLDVSYSEAEGTSRQLSGRAVDLRARDGVEYLLLANGDADPAWLRLDRLLSVVRVRDGACLIGSA